MKRDVKDMLSSFYGFFADAKNVLFDSGFADSLKVRQPVISVGNLSMGGTGKTPIVHEILSLAKTRDRKPAVISRNYKAESRGINKVDLNHKDGASYFGDEAFFLAQAFPDVSVWTGPKKYLTAQEASVYSEADLLIVDDGFQHRSLHRDFDLVLLDCTSRRQDDFLVPQGRLREGFDSLKRADAVALTKMNWAHPDRVLELRKMIPSHVEVYETEFHQFLDRHIEPDEPVLAVSGIANPSVFEKNMKDQQIAVLEHLVFPDHFHYTAKHVQTILEAFHRFGCKQIVTTEKDFVKLCHFADLKELLNPVLVRAEFTKEPQGLYAFLDGSRRI